LSYPAIAIQMKKKIMTEKIGKYEIIPVERKYTIKYIYRRGNLKEGIPFSAFTYNYNPANQGNNI
jgi:hypothetical protein